MIPDLRVNLLLELSLGRTSLHVNGNAQAKQHTDADEDHSVDGNLLVVFFEVHVRVHEVFASQIVALHDHVASRRIDIETGAQGVKNGLISQLTAISLVVDNDSWEQGCAIADVVEYLFFNQVVDDFVILIVVRFSSGHGPAVLYALLRLVEAQLQFLVSKLRTTLADFSLAKIADLVDVIPPKLFPPVVS